MIYPEAWTSEAIFHWLREGCGVECITRAGPPPARSGPVLAAPAGRRPKLNANTGAAFRTQSPQTSGESRMIYPQCCQMRPRRRLRYILRRLSWQRWQICARPRVSRTQSTPELADTGPEWHTERQGNLLSVRAGAVLDAFYGSPAERRKK